MGLKEQATKYIIEAVFALVLSLIAFFMRRLQKRVKVEISESTHVKQGVLALLHNQLYQNCNAHLQDGYIGIQDRKNLEYMFKAYSGLGGNGTCADIYASTRGLSYLPTDDEKKAPPGHTEREDETPWK